MNFNPTRPHKLQHYTAFDLETCSLSPFHGGITCIVAINEKGDVFKEYIPRVLYTNFGSPFDEFKLIRSFMRFLYKQTFTTLLTFNGKNFDIPFLLTRMVELMNNCPQEYLDLKKYRHLDIAETTTYHTKLHSYAEILNVPAKSGTGLQAISLWKKEKYKELVDYCEQDVKVTINVYKKLLELNK